MTTFYLVRHGDKEFIPGDPPLNSTGIKQAEKTAEYLQNLKIKAIYSSHLKRVQQTAQIISKVLNLPIFIDKRLIERLNWGDKVGQTFEEFNIEWRKTDKDRNYKPAFGNSSFEAGNNLKLLLDEMALKYPNQNILIVTSGGTIGDFLRNAFKEENLPFTINKKTNAKYIEILGCSITEVKKQADTYILKTVNDIDHVQGL